MAVDENGEPITGEMTDYKPYSVALVPWGASDRKALTMRGMTKEEAEAIRAQGVAVSEEAEPEPSWASAFRESITKGLMDALKPLQNIFSSKGSDDTMAQATQTQTQREEAVTTETAAAESALTPEAKAEIQKMIDDSIKTALDAYKKEDATQDAASDVDSCTAAMSAPAEAAAAAAPVQAEAAKSADTEDLKALVALVQKQADDNAKLTAALQQTLTARGAGQAAATGNADHVDSEARQTGTWGSSSLMAAVYRGAANA